LPFQIYTKKEYLHVIHLETIVFLLTLKRMTLAYD